MFSWPHVHSWSRWSDPLPARDVFGLTIVVQRRVCSGCGKVKLREIKADGLSIEDV